MRNLRRKTRKPYHKPMTVEQRDQVIRAILNAGGNASAERMIVNAMDIMNNPTTNNH